MKNICFIPYKNDNNDQNISNENTKRKFDETDINNDELNKKIKTGSNDDEIKEQIKFKMNENNSDNKTIIQSDIKKNKVNENLNEIKLISVVNDNENKNKQKPIDVVNDNNDDDSDCILSLGSINKTDLNQRYDVFCNG